jgi:asparagine synthase (glutamine-hydrolysing)
MRFSVESRVPFLTRELADFLLSLPEAYLISPEGETKHIFRLRCGVSFRMMFWTDATRSASKRLRRSGCWEWPKPFVAGCASTCILPFFVQAEVLKEFDLIATGKKPFSWQVWRWINFSRWYSHFVA